MLHVDIPTAADLRSLITYRNDICVSIYMATTALSQGSGADRIELKNLAKQAAAELEAAGADKRRTLPLAEHLDDLIDDDDFWRHQARSLAVLATPEGVRTFRLASALEPLVEVSGRFYLKPLMRAVTFPNACYVLALSEGAVRIIEVPADLPASDVKVHGMPRDAADAVGKATINDRTPSGRIQGSEGQKVRLRQYARKVDSLLHPLLRGSDLPLILAATEPLSSIYRSVNHYPHLAPHGIEGSPDGLTDGQLADRARPVLDALYREQLTAWRERFDASLPGGRATTDVAQAARAATTGAVDALLVNIDVAVPGTIDDGGAVTFADAPGPHSYGVVDEIADRVILSGGHVLAVRTPDVPDGKSLAAILRYPI